MIPTEIYYIYTNSFDSNELAIECLRKYCKGVENNDSISMTKDIYGKPHTNITGVYLSISHTVGLWICAISRVPIGIDVERFDVKIKEPLFSLIREEDVADNLAVRFWTRIESCSKLIGTGLLTKLDELISYVNGGNFYFSDIEIDSDYLCTVCLCACNSASALRFHCVKININD